METAGNHKAKEKTKESCASGGVRLMEKNYECYENSNMFFKYRDTAYLKGAEVTFSDDFIKHFRHEDKPIWKYARFHTRVIHSRAKITYIFTRRRTDFWWLKDHGMTWDDYHTTCPYFIIEEPMPDDAIEEVTKGLETKIVPLPKYKDWEIAEVMVGWVIYILTLFACLIFKEFWSGWIAASIVFFTIRKGLLNR